MTHLIISYLLVILCCLTGCSKDESIGLEMTVKQYTEAVVESSSTDIVESGIDDAAKEKIDYSKAEYQPSPDMYESKDYDDDTIGNKSFSSLPSIPLPTKETTTAVPTTTVASTTIAYTQPVTLPPTTAPPTTEAPTEPLPTIPETEAVDKSQQGVHMEKASSLLSENLEVTYPVRGDVAYRKQIDIPDVLGYDKDAYGNYIINPSDLKDNYTQLPKFTKYGYKIPYMYWYNSKGEILNPLPSMYNKYKDMFYFGKEEIEEWED